MRTTEKMPINRLIKRQVAKLRRHGSLLSKNSSRVFQPPPTRTVTELLTKRTRQSFPRSPN